MRPVPIVAVVTLALLLPGCLDGLLDDGRTDWAYGTTQLDAAATLGRTGKGVTVALLDTGINLKHPSLDHLADGDRSNGEVVAFRDFLGDATQVAQAFDEDGHGSHVAGILAARGGSGGITGFDLKGGAPSVLLVVARVCAGEDCVAAVIDDAVRWAVAQGADVISMSLGGDAGFNLGGLAPTDLETAINDAIDRGVVVLASAGNKGPNNQDVESPASIPGVLAVGAIGPDGKVADFSSRGDDAGHPCRPLTLPIPSLASRCAPDQKPELVAPGVGIVSAWTGKQYASADGTSQATPFVTATVALMLEGKSLAGRSDVERLKQALMDSAAPLDGQATPHDPASGYGLVQARDALRAYAGL